MTRMVVEERLDERALTSIRAKLARLLVES